MPKILTLQFSQNNVFNKFISYLHYESFIFYPCGVCGYDDEQLQ